MGRSRFSRSTGYSLIELLAAMAILMTIVSMMSIIFTDSDKAWRFGADRAESDCAGRAAVAMMVNDLQYAAADNLLSLVHRRDRYALKSYGFTNSEICFASIQHDSSDEPPARSVREIFYWVRMREQIESTGEGVVRFELVRGYYGPDISDDSGSVPDYLRHCYWNRDWFENPVLGGKGRPANNAVIAQNVSGLRFTTPWDTLDASDRLDCYYSADSPYNGKLPPYLDIFLELLDEHVAIEVARMIEMGLPEAEILAKTEKNAHRYTSRIYFFNRAGYHPRHQDPDKYPDPGP